ncbi:MAG: ROK family transcriptional regulator, partial [Microbacterium sp.]
MAVLSTAAAAGEILELIRSGRASTRNEIREITGLSRSTLAERLDALFRTGIVGEGPEQASSGGRPPRTLRIEPDAFVVLAADVGETRTRLCLVDLAGRVVDDVVGVLPIDRGPRPVIDWILDEGDRMRDASGIPPARLLGIGIAVPAPVDFAAGEVVGPSVMTGWEGVAVRDLVGARADVPVVVENDVNARGLGEVSGRDAEAEHILYVKAGTGIGSAIITGGALFRGSQGSAGDIG